MTRAATPLPKRCCSEGPSLSAAILNGVKHACKKNSDHAVRFLNQITACEFVFWKLESQDETKSFVCENLRSSAPAASARPCTEAM